MSSSTQKGAVFDSQDTAVPSKVEFVVRLVDH
jgi:hypothetical protein